MPVTAKLSRKFYERLGDEVANELVDWLNAVDQSYRQEFRELFEAHFGRLEAEMRALEERVRSEIKGLEERLRGELRLFEKRLVGAEEHTSSKMTLIEERAGGALRQLETRMDGKLATLKSELLAWMFAFWIGTVAAGVLTRLFLG